VQRIAPISVVAVFLAVALAYGAGLVLAVIAGIGLGLFGGYFVDANGESIFLSTIVFAAGSAPSFISGFLAAWFARRRELLHALIAGLAYLVWIASIWLWPHGDPVSWTDILHYVLVMPLSLLGGVTAKYRHRKQFVETAKVNSR
jgi:hypothetical protein